MTVNPSLSKTSSHRSSGSNRRAPTTFFVVGLTVLLIVMFALRTENKMLSIMRPSLELDLVEATGATDELTSSFSPFSKLPMSLRAAAMSTATSWNVGMAEMKRDAPDLGNWQSPEARATAELSGVPAWILDMGAQHEKRIFSQYGEDGFTEYILNNLPSPATVKTYVEFGVETGMECNTRFLRENHNWSGLMMDGGTERPEIGLHKEMIHPDNVVSLFEKYGVQKRFGVFSEDTDYADYYLWRSVLDAGYRPRILISEHNSNFFADESFTVHDPGRNLRMWKGNDYYGVSALALRRLWNKHGYLMVYCTKLQVNCFGVHQDDVLLPKDRNPAGLKAAQEALWAKPLAWPKKMHGCSPDLETWSYVGENGDLVEGVEFTPRVLQHCRDKAGLKGSQMRSE
jgi:hypothetical protein